MRDYEIFKPKTNLVWASVSYFLILVLVIQSIFYPAKIEHIAINALIAILGILATHVIWVRPKLVFHREFIQVINPFTKVNIRYSEIEGIDTEWSLQIKHKSIRTRVWVAPANGRRSALGRVGTRINGGPSSVYRSTSDSELAAQLIQTRLDAH